MRAGMAGRGRLARAGMVVALACAAASLTGCAVAAATADEVHRDFTRVLVTTQELVGGDWEVRDDPASRACANSRGVGAVSYTHLDVYKRQVLTSTMRGLGYTIRTELGRTAVEKAKLQLSMLKSISNALGDASGNTNRCLLYTSRCV